MDLNAYIRPLIKWWRLLIAVILLAIISSSISTFFQPRVYLSRTTLMIGRTILDPNPDSGQIYIAQQLASIYSDMANREPIQVATMEALGMDWLPKYQAKTVPNTQLIEISVTDTVPQRAQIVANELARQLVLQSPATSDTETGQRQEFIKNQLSGLQVQIQETEQELAELQKRLLDLNSASQIADTEKQISELSTKLSDLRANYADLLANTQSGALNTLTIVEPANLPTKSVGINKYLIIGLAAAVGLLLGAGAAYLIEYLDKSIKTSSDVSRVLNFPVVGYFTRMSENGSNGTIVANNPHSLISENFRVLRSNIEFAQADNSIQTILVTSPGQGNGKTTIATNLAISLAQLEKKVVLVDADLRRPTVHKILKMSRGPGLADAIQNKEKTPSAVRPWKDDSVSVITAGETPPNVTEVVGSKLIGSILTNLKKNFEIVIVDAPPLIISDAYNLASKVDGVILVIESGQTREEEAVVIKERLNRAGANILGVVLNRISPTEAKTYGDYNYHTYYSEEYTNYEAGKARKKPTDSPARKLLAFFESGEVSLNFSRRTGKNKDASMPVESHGKDEVEDTEEIEPSSEEVAKKAAENPPAAKKSRSRTRKRN